MKWDTEVSVVVMDVKLSAKVKKQVDDRLGAGKCLQCEKPVYRRGLCSCHYGRYRTALQEQPKKARGELEARMIEKGMIASDRQGHRPNVVNVFRDFAEKG